MGKDGVGLVVTLPTAVAGTLTFDIGNSPSQVDVFATAAEQFPAPLRRLGRPVAREAGAAPAPTPRSRCRTPVSHVLIV